MKAARLIMGAFLVLSLVAMVFAIVNDGPDCNDPVTWSTEAGVRHCAINPEGE